MHLVRRLSRGRHTSRPEVSTDDLKIIDFHLGSIAEEHICCTFSDKKCADGYAAKKRWLSEQYASGYRFERLDARGKVCIESGPAEHAWLPLDVPGYMVADCVWVSGRVVAAPLFFELWCERLDPWAAALQCKDSAKAGRISGRRYRGVLLRHAPFRRSLDERGAARRCRA
jgi:hypothetical protein